MCDIIPELCARLTDEEREFILKFRSLTKERQDKIIEEILYPKKDNNANQK